MTETSDEENPWHPPTNTALYSSEGNAYTEVEKYSDKYCWSRKFSVVNYICQNWSGIKVIF